MKRIQFLLAVIVVLTCFVSCSGKRANPKPNDVTGTVMPVSPTGTPTAEATPSPTAAPSPTATSAPTVSSTPVPTPAYEEPYIVWATHFQGSGYISEDVRQAIQKCVDENGIACKVVFLTEADEQYFAFGEEYEQWYEKQKEAGTIPDIMQIGIGSRSSFCFRFAREKLLPLKEYLHSEEGQSLLNAYTEAEWRKVSIDGEYYTVPVRLDGSEIPGSYLYVKTSEYEDFKEKFDGSYQSLRDFCNSRTSADPIIATNFVGPSMMAFNNCCEVFGIAALNIADRKFFNPAKDPALRQLAEMIYDDVCSEKLVNGIEANQIPGNAVVYFSSLRLLDLQGYTEVMLHLSQNTSPGPGYGIAAESSKKELALQVLNACYSDPEIASLIDWGYTDVNRWEKWTGLMQNPGPNYAIGFIPVLSDEQYDLLTECYGNVGKAFGQMFVSSPDNGEMVLNQKYSECLEEAFADDKDYSAVLDVLNKQYEEWLEKANRE